MYIKLYGMTGDLKPAGRASEAEPSSPSDTLLTHPFSTFHDIWVLPGTSGYF